MLSAEVSLHFSAVLVTWMVSTRFRKTSKHSVVSNLKLNWGLTMCNWSVCTGGNPILSMERCSNWTTVSNSPPPPPSVPPPPRPVLLTLAAQVLQPHTVILSRYTKSANNLFCQKDIKKCAPSAFNLNYCKTGILPVKTDCVLCIFSSFH